VQEVRLEPVGDAAVLRVVLQSTAGEVKHTVLQDPYRLVLDIHRPRESGGAGEPGRGTMQPLRLIVLTPPRRRDAGPWATRSGEGSGAGRDAPRGQEGRGRPRREGGAEP
jgi:hypothetical protein